jgi:hypothetical protein
MAFFCRILVYPVFSSFCIASLSPNKQFPSQSFHQNAFWHLSPGPFFGRGATACIFTAFFLSVFRSQLTWVEKRIEYIYKPLQVYIPTAIVVAGAKTTILLSFVPSLSFLFIPLLFRQAIFIPYYYMYTSYCYYYYFTIPAFHWSNYFRHCMGLAIMSVKFWYKP